MERDENQSFEHRYLFDEMSFRMTGLWNGMKTEKYPDPQQDIPSLAQQIADTLLTETNWPFLPSACERQLETHGAIEKEGKCLAENCSCIFHIHYIPVN